MKKAIKIILILLLVIVALVLAYLAYVLIDYHRIGDQTLPVITYVGDNTRRPAAGQSYDIVSWNIGFGAYEADYGFFMDGGTQSRAWSKKRLNANLNAIEVRLREQDADILLVQEVDTDATRSYHMHEDAELAKDLLGCRDYVQVFAQNYDSPYLMYPITQPHGASKSGLSTFCDFTIDSAQRVELPIESGFTKFLDLDRCYSRSFIPTENGKTLVLYNLHLSAYTSDGSIATEQLKLLLADMQGQYEAGNYCIAGGDFNKDLLGDSGAYFGAADKEYTWAQPIPPEVFDGYDITLVAPLDEDAPVPSCRNADGPYHPGQYVLTVDGFLVSANVQVEHSEVIDYGFAYSDHNPVRMRFTLLDDGAVNALAVEEQLAVLAENLGSLENVRKILALERVAKYAVTDLDGNGRLELVVSALHGMGQFTFTSYYEVDEDGSGVTAWVQNKWETDSEADIMRNESIAVYVDADGTRHFLFDDYIISSTAEYWQGKYDVTYGNGQVTRKVLAGCASVYQYETEKFVSTYTDADGTPITEEEFNSIGDTVFAGTRKYNAHIGWTYYDKLEGLSKSSLMEQLATSYDAFSIE